MVDSGLPVEGRVNEKGMLHPRPAPPWAAKYFRSAAWTHQEFRNLLCGLSPQGEHMPPIPADAAARQVWSDAWQRDELRRLDADRRIRDAILVGELSPLEPRDDQLLEKIRPHLTGEDFEMLRQAVVHARSCDKAYLFEREAAQRWAAARPDLFPDFPDAAIDDDRQLRAVTPELKRHRRSLIKRAVEKQGIERAELVLEGKKVHEDTLRGMVNSNPRRVSAARTKQILKLLGIPERDWNTPP